MNLHLRQILYSMFLVFLAYSKYSMAKNHTVTEKGLVDTIKKEHLQSQKAMLQKTSAGFQHAKIKEVYDTNFNTSITRKNSTIPALNSFQPVFGPLDVVQIGLSKHIGKGISTSYGLYTEKYTSIDGGIVDQTYAGAKFGIEVDLWKNFQGWLEKAQLRKMEYSLKKAQLLGKIEVGSAISSTRKLYWSIIANRMQRKSMKALVAQVQRQKAQAEKRYSAGVGEKGDVYRSDSQLSDTKAALTGIEYQYQNMLINLKKIIPSYNEKELIFPIANIDQNMSLVMECTKLILGQKNIPWENTLYDEVLKLSDRAYIEARKADGRYASSDLKFTYEHKYAALGENYVGAQTALSEDAEQEFTANLTFTKALTARKSSSEALKKRTTYLNYKIENDQLRSLVSSRHSQMADMISLLQMAVSQRKSTGESLKKILEESKRLHRLARIPLETLISDQSQYYQSEYDTVSAQLLVMHELLDYFSVFTQTPCRLNSFREKL